MELTRLAIIGAGSVRCSPPVIAALATYFGERPLEIRLYDSDEERLDLFDRFARICFTTTKATHRLLYRLDPIEALQDVDRVVLQMGTNCARKYLRATGRLSVLDYRDFHEPIGSLQKDGYLPLSYDAELIQQAIDLILPAIPEEAMVLSLQEEEIRLPERFRRTEWPPSLNLAQRMAIPHQILRWVHGEEYPYALMQAEERSPLKAWLDDVTADLA